MQNLFTLNGDAELVRGAALLLDQLGVAAGPSGTITVTLAVCVSGNGAGAGWEDTAKAVPGESGEEGRKREDGKGIGEGEDREEKKESEEVRITVSLRNREASVHGSTRVRVFRGLGLLLNAIREKLESSGIAGEVLAGRASAAAAGRAAAVLAALQFDCSETLSIPHTGAMLDCSRNAVFTINAIQTLVGRMALFGMDRLMLYLEDLYPITGYPYFGYMRGRYTREEIAALQHTCDLLGIELIPGIQTLGHLATALRWKYADSLRDTGDILNVGSDGVYRFIDRMLSAVTGLFTSKRIHVGMDEAEALGLGQYLQEHGYAESGTLFDGHLERVAALCREHGLQPMIWSDMLLRTRTAGGGYYAADPQLSPEVLLNRPEGVRLVYWDYYHLDEDFYRRYLTLHGAGSGESEMGQRQNEGPIFAGGCWSWNGVAPNYSLALAATDAALSACRQLKVTEAWCTIWFDDGAETPLETAYPMLAYFAAHGYSSGKPDPGQYAGPLFITTGVFWHDIMLLDRFDALPGGSECNRTSDNPSKWLLYQDPMTGLFDTYAAEAGIPEHYGALNRSLGKCAAGIVSSDLRALFRFYRQLAKVLAGKCDLGVRIRRAYLADDRKVLEQIGRAEIPRIIEEVRELQRCRRALWLRCAKPFGLEVLDGRFGHLLARLEYAGMRIASYISGEVAVLEELEEERMPFMERESGSERRYCACNSWRLIVSAGTV